MNALKMTREDRRELRHFADSCKFGLKCSLTAVVIGLAFCMGTSLLGLFVAPVFVNDALDRIW